MILEQVVDAAMIYTSRRCLKFTLSNHGKNVLDNTHHCVAKTALRSCYIIQLFPEGEVNSGGYITRREASR